MFTPSSSNLSLTARRPQQGQPAHAHAVESGNAFSLATKPQNQVAPQAVQPPQFGSRAREMLIEDFVGFGLLRTAMDLFRGYFFDTEEKINIPAARERVLREACSILTDNVSYGLAAFGLGALLDKSMGGFSNRFSNFASVEAFRDAAHISTGEEVFLRQLASDLGGKDHETWEKALTKWWGELDAIPKDNFKKTLAERKNAAATELAKELKLPSFDFKKPNESAKAYRTEFRLDEVFEDLGFLKSHLKERVAKSGGQSWREVATDTLNKTLKIKYLKLACLSIGVAATFAVPFFNTWLTKKIDKIDYYPGEIGLKNTWREKPKTQAPGTPNLFTNNATFRQFSTAQQRTGAAPKTWFERECPYIADSVKKNNWLPVAIALLPLPFVAGSFNTVTRKFFNPFKPGFLKTLRNAYDFEKAGPFTTQQQMASMFALLITSRLLSARSPNEYRERMVDSFLGWGLWIMGTPFIKRMVAKMWDPNLLKKVGDTVNLRTAAEISLLPKEVQAVTAQRLKRLSTGSTIASMILLGIVEPYLAIMWTKKNAHEARSA